MKKALLALALLGGMLFVSVWNMHHLDAFTDQLENTLVRSRARWELGDAEGASALAEQALNDWFDAESYTHVFIRHAEVDSATDAFYDLLAALSDEDTSSAGRAYERVIAHLHMIDAMEHVTLKSVF